MMDSYRAGYDQVLSTLRSHLSSVGSQFFSPFFYLTPSFAPDIFGAMEPKLWRVMRLAVDPILPNENASYPTFSRQDVSHFQLSNCCAHTDRTAF
jgi:hypothetical protein